MSLCQQLAAYFEARPNRWIDARHLLPIAGYAAWRTRLSQLRRPPYNMTIENTWSDVENQDGTKYRHSMYRYVPAAVPRPSLGNGLPRSVERMASPGRLFDDPR